MAEVSSRDPPPKGTSGRPPATCLPLPCWRAGLTLPFFAAANGLWSLCRVSWRGWRGWEFCVVAVCTVAHQFATPPGGTPPKSCMACVRIMKGDLPATLTAPPPCGLPRRGGAALPEERLPTMPGVPFSGGPTVLCACVGVVLSPAGGVGGNQLRSLPCCPYVRCRYAATEGMAAASFMTLGRLPASFVGFPRCACTAALPAGRHWQEVLGLVCTLLPVRLLHVRSLTHA